MGTLCGAPKSSLTSSRADPKPLTKERRKSSYLAEHPKGFAALLRTHLRTPERAPGLLVGKTRSLRLVP